MISVGFMLSRLSVPLQLRLDNPFTPLLVGIQCDVKSEDLWERRLLNVGRRLRVFDLRANPLRDE